MKMHGCVMGFEHFGHHSRHGRKHHDRGHHEFGPRMFGQFGPFAFGHNGHHGPRRFGPHGHGHGCFGERPFHFEIPGFGRGPLEFRKHGHPGHGKHGFFGKRGHHGAGPRGCGEDVQDFDRFVDRNGFEWRLYISGDDAAAGDSPVHETTCEEENARNEARESSDSECERPRRCWEKHCSRRFSKHGRKGVMSRKKSCCGKSSRQECGPSAPPMEQNAPLIPETSTATVPAEVQEPSGTAAGNANT